MQSRNILKIILLILARLAIKKHSIKFIVICGWHRTRLVREELYNYLSEDYNVRRNIQNIWWDFSLPLNILGYTDRRYSIRKWVKIIFKTIGALLFAPRNPHKIILDLNFSDPDTSKYWKKIIKPEVLVILNYKQIEKELFTYLVESTQKAGGAIFVSANLKSRFPKAKYFSVDKYYIYTPEGKYKYSEAMQGMFVDTYPPVLSVLSHYGWDEERIRRTISPYNMTDEVISKITSNIIKLKLDD